MLKSWRVVYHNLASVYDMTSHKPVVLFAFVCRAAGKLWGGWSP